ncbi:MAG: CBS domain-containing protein [Bacteroidetes bacterium]|nr:MAG: CBS domain-containing protein [Bacteroidota bacterium]
MTAKELINYSIPSLNQDEKVQNALDFMEELKIEQLAVVDNQTTYQGLISEEILLNATDNEEALNKFPLQHQDSFVFEHQHFYDVLAVFQKGNHDLVAVLDQKHILRGVIPAKDMMPVFSKIYSAQESGGILIISMLTYDYSLGKISQLVEANGAKILSSYLESDPADSTRVLLTLKTNQDDLNYIIATLERYDYRIVAQFQQNKPVNLHEDRIGLLLKFLEF